MKYYIKRISDADGYVFSVLDHLCVQTFRIKTARPFPSCRFYVENDAGIAAKIVRIPLPSVRAYSISCPDINFRIMLSEDSCAFYGIDWSVRGSILMNNYDLLDSNGKTVAAAISHCTVASAVELNIFDGEPPLPCICAAVCFNLAQTVDNLSVQPV